MQGQTRIQAPWRFFIRVLTPSLLTLVLVAALAISAVNVLGGVRAYVAGESMWSKARSEAVFHVLRYAQSHEAADLVAYREALKVPEGDRLAREAMNHDPMDRPRISAYLQAGGNHADDVDNMIMLFQRLADRWVFKEALQAWIEGDALILQLDGQAHALEEAVRAQAPLQQIQVNTSQIVTINDKLKQHEFHFGQSLGRAARMTENALIGTIIGSALLLSLINILLTRRMLNEQVAHQATLAGVNRRWELASTAAGLGLYELNTATDEVQLDAKAAKLHGLGDQPITVPRQTLRRLILTEDQPQVRQQVDKAGQTSQVLKLIYRIRCPDASIHTLEATGRMEGPALDAPARLIGVVRDITEELAQAEAAMERDAAERVSQAQRDFLSRLSHELRTPLNAILGFAQLMLSQRTPPLPASSVRQTQLILTAGEHLLALVEDVFDLSKVESGQIPMTLQSVDLVATLRACLSLVDGARARLDVHIVDELPQRPLMVQADPQRLLQIFMNLLSNACKYNQQGGEVRLRARQEGQRVLADVLDSGVGLTPQEIDQLFQPFKRIDVSTHVEGTGLGLYIVKQLAEHMNGHVSVQSHKGRGSRFTLDLPTATDEHAVDASLASTNAPGQ
jgi:signal transduction histidine kinase